MYWAPGGPNGMHVSDLKLAYIAALMISIEVKNGTA